MPPNAAAGAAAPAEEGAGHSPTVPSSDSTDSPSSPVVTTSSSPLLNIFLRINTTGPRLDSASTYNYLTLRDLYLLRTICHPVRRALQSIEYNRCRDGKDYLVPFPSYPGILSTADDLRAGAGLFPHQLASLAAMHRAENTHTDFGALRGGILGDAPGLGKTITMLAHIASTAGCKPVQPAEFFDNDSIDEHWKLMRVNPVFRMEILKSIKPLRDWVADHPSDHELARVFKDMQRYVSPPYDDDRLPTLRSFERYVRITMAKHIPFDLLELFRRNVNAFKAGLDKRNRRFFASDKGQRIEFERSLIPSSSTLIIVPDALLEHWAEQMRRHLHLEMFADGGGANAGTTVQDGGAAHGVVHIDGVGDLSEARFPLNHQAGQLASAYHLMSHMIVVVPFSRIQDQFRTRKRRRHDDDDDVIEMESYKNSPLLQLRWFRVVVDEGHELGASHAGSEVTQFINLIASERRWVLSGTPTTGDEDSPVFTAMGLNQLQRLLLFLRHPKYGIVPISGDSSSNDGGRRTNSRHGAQVSKQQNKDSAKLAWEVAIKTPFLRKQEAGRLELYKIMDEIMVMHKKEDINLPKPIFKQGEVSVAVPLDVQTDIVDAVCSEKRDVDDYLDVLYQMGVEVERRGADLDYKLQVALNSNGGSAVFDVMLSEYLRTDKYQMLVDEAQAKYVANTVKSERRQLEMRGGAIENVLGSPITLAANADSYSKLSKDRRPVKAVVYSESHNNLLDVADYLYDTFPRENIAEMCEGRIAEMTYELGRFRNNYKEGKHCPICNCWNEYKGRNLTSCYNRLLEVEDAEGNIFLIEPERIRRAISVDEFNAWSPALRADMLGSSVMQERLPGTEPDKMCKFGLSPKYWRVNDALMIDARDPHPLLPSRWSQEQWEQYGSQRCMELAERDMGLGRDNYFGPLPEYDDEDEGGNGDGGLNVIVKIRKWSQCGVFHGRRWYAGPSMVDNEIETIKEDTFILLLDASLAHGLDLSFVTHLFLLEPIDDAALLEQVTSRAHRLGCTGPVVVETVNVWQELDEKTKAVAKQLASTVVDDEEGNRRTSTAVCEHCYRSFENIEKAEIHEHTCERNPDGSAVVDPYHLSSVYRDIRPPPPISVGDSRAPEVEEVVVPEEENDENGADVVSGQQQLAAAFENEVAEEDNEDGGELQRAVAFEDVEENPSPGILVGGGDTSMGDSY